MNKKLYWDFKIPKITTSKRLLRIFNLANLFLLLFTINVYALRVNAQSKTVIIKQKVITISQIIKEIEKQTEFLFVYSKQEVDLNRKVKLDIQESSVNSLLQVAFNRSGLSYEIKDVNIILKKNDHLKINESSQQKGKTLSGIIKGTNGEPIIGASVIELGTTNGTVSDLEGRFTLSSVQGNEIKLSYIGYIPQTIKIGNKTKLDIILEEDTQTLNEVVVVGFGTQKKVNLTGSVETVDSKTLENRPIRSATDALQGAVSGITIQSGTGQPGEFSSLKVRGNTSINSGGALVIIDGLPGNINHVSPQDIESISVLKDAASAAIYGARAAEGVILITTKQGKSEKTRIEYSGNLSFNTPTRLPQSNDGYNHALLSNLAFTNAGLAVNFPQEALDAIKNSSAVALPKGNDFIYTADNDWISLMMDHSFQQNHNLTVSKASDKLNYLFSTSWLDQNGMFSEYGPDNFDRINFLSNVGLDIIKDKLTFNSKVTYVGTDKKYHPQFGGWSIPYITFIQAGPNMPIYDYNGNYARYRMQGNPIQAMKEGGEGIFKQQKIEGIFTLSYKPVKGLVLKAIGGAILQNNQTKEFRRQYGKYGPNGLISIGAGQYGPNNIIQKSSYNQYLTGQFLAEYSTIINSVHDIKVLGGWSVEENKYEDLEAKRTDIVGNLLPALKLGSTDGWSNDADENEWALASGFMRLNYVYASKYLFEANFRADGSSRFSKKNRWGIFPSASIGWRISEEKFMRNQKIFSNLKMRLSWGELGNQNGLGYYDHIAQYKVGGYYPFASGLGQWAVNETLPSEERTWETVVMKNAAIDMSFLNNRLSLTGEYFIKKNKDMLVNIEIPSVIGINVPTGNYGELEVKGWEISIGWKDHIKDFSYGVNFNLSDQKDKLVNYGVKYNGFTQGINQKIQGYSLGAIFGYETDGYFQSQEEVEQSAVYNKAITGPGDIKYIDQDGDKKISAPNDLKYLGTTMPRYIFGLNFNAEWKGFDVSITMQGVGKRDFYINQEIMAPFSVTWGNFSYKMHNDYWTPENPNASLPRHYAGSGHNYQISNHWLQNAAYVRLKNLQAGYTLPKNITNKLGINRCRIYFSGDNLAEISKLNKNFDPELTNTSGVMYPIMRSFSFGLNLAF